MIGLRQKLALWCVAKLFRVRAHGVAYLRPGQGGMLVMINHDHPWDWFFLAPFLSPGTRFALHPREMPSKRLRVWCDWIEFVSLDPMDPDGIKPLVRHLKNDGVVALFASGGGMGQGAVGKVSAGIARLPELAGVPVAAVWMRHAGYRGVVRELTVQSPQRVISSVTDLMERAALYLEGQPATLWDTLRRSVR
ncbi:MAG: 1-acyl-sn-glycerol-3-phosphate acyltransferase, partial [Magnetococcales bacterium]|nr:1-acyl-sn-glycerol-3-phosphate acyltransferase [Magnetococcales bacterium]